MHLSFWVPVFLSILITLQSCQVHGATPVINVVSTSKSGDKLTVKDDIPFEPLSPSSIPVGSYVLTLDKNKKFQQITGFGGAITEASTTIMKSLNKTMQEKIIQAYYSKQGLRYTIGRVHMNSCDFSLNSYSFDDIDGDFSLSHFDKSLRHNVDNNMIPVIQRALSEANGNLRLFFTPWSPPAWMKTNGQMTGSGSPCLKPGDEYQQAWADYYVKFAKAHEQYNIRYWGLTVQNEPEFAAPWEACTYTPAQERDFIKDFLAPTLQKNGLDYLKIIIYDHNKDDVFKWAQVILSDPVAASYVWGTGLHWYSGDSFDNVNATHFFSPNHHIFPTEACHCPFALNDFSRGEKYAHDIIGDLNSFAEGWTDWNIVLNGQGGPNHLGNMCDAPILAEESWPDIHFQPTYYAMGHFSKFLPPQSTRISWELKKTLSNGRSNVMVRNGEKIPNKNLKRNVQDSPLEIISFVSNEDYWQQVKKWPESSTGSPVTGFKNNLNSNGINGPSANEKLVIVVLNSSDNNSTFYLTNSNSFAEIQVPQHTIITLTMDASLF